jgi:pimeloyl-ACP methyl ester carboxylesterase
MAKTAPMPYTPAMLIEPKSVFVSATDGLRLHARVYGAPTAQRLPVVCLPGLTRTEADFERLASALADDDTHPRQVYALDYRGRGQSDYDRDPTHYSFQTELADVVAVMTALDCMPAVIVGTSRGGILTMLLGALRPSAIAGVVLNDIGPVIDPQGLMHIKGYVGKLPQPRDYEEGAEILRRLFSGQFPKLGHADWLAWARRAFKEDKGPLVSTYDVRLATTLEGFDLEQPLPPLWKEFDALARFPLLLIRGANSDLLTPETVAAMRAHRRQMDLLEVPDQGHAPLLVEPEVIGRIKDFVRGCDC